MFYNIIIFMLFSSVLLESSESPKSNSIPQSLIPNAQPASGSKPGILVNDVQISDLQLPNTNPNPQLSGKLPNDFLSKNTQLTEDQFDSSDSFFESVNKGRSQLASNDSQRNTNNSALVSQRPKTRSSMHFVDKKEEIADPFSALTACLRIANRRHSRYSPNGLEQSQRRSLSSSQNNAAMAASISNDSTSDTDETDNQQNAQGYLNKAKEAFRSLRQQSSAQDTTQKTTPITSSANNPLFQFIFPEKQPTEPSKQ